MMPFTPEDFKTPAWAKYKEYCHDRIEHLHVTLEGSLTPDATEKIRGRIAELRLVLTLDEPLPKPPNRQE
jgi:hypothetical protein